MIDPTKAARLLELPEIKDLVAHLNEELSRINTLDDIPSSKLRGIQNPQLFAIHFNARIIARDILEEILTPLVERSPLQTSSSMGKEYAVE